MVIDQSGLLEWFDLSEWSRWSRPREQDTTSGGSSGRNFIKIRQGSKMAVEESIVALSWERPYLVKHVLFICHLELTLKVNLTYASP